MIHIYMSTFHYTTELFGEMMHTSDDDTDDDFVCTKTKHTIFDKQTCTKPISSSESNQCETLSVMYDTFGPSFQNTSSQNTTPQSPQSKTTKFAKFLALQNKTPLNCSLKSKNTEFTSVSGLAPANEFSSFDKCLALPENCAYIPPIKNNNKFFTSINEKITNNQSNSSNQTSSKNDQNFSLLNESEIGIRSTHNIDIQLEKSTTKSYDFWSCCSSIDVA